jgi:hypothetical protein
LAGRASFPPERFVARPCRYGRGLAGGQVQKDILEIKLSATDTNYILISLIFIWKMYVYQGKIRNLSFGKAEKMIGIS